MNPMKLNEFAEIFNKYFTSRLREITDISDFSRVLRHTPESGGKRLRPYLIYLFGTVLEIDSDLLMEVGTAVEIFHSGSLIHDDLPAIDNDDYRRGSLTLHKVYGEDKAILAGDFLMLYPIKILAGLPIQIDRKEKILKFWVDSSLKVIEGEYLDIKSEKMKNREFDSMREIHLRKTAALFAFCFGIPFLIAGKIDKAREYGSIGSEFGLIFQQLDDIKDELSTIEELGKTPGKDAVQGKVTILNFMELREAVNHTDTEFRRTIERIEYSEIRRTILELKDLIRKS